MRRELTAAFPAEVVRQAVALVGGGRVHLLRAEWPIVGRVNGHIVTVHRRTADRYVRADCSCDEARDCVHAAAVYFVARTQEGEAAFVEQERRKQRAVSDWLANVVASSEPPAPKREAENAVVYLLSGDGGSIRLAVHRTTRLRSGRWGKSAALQSAIDPSRGLPSWVEPEDLRRIALLRASTRIGPAERSFPVERLDANLFDDLTSSGRLFWESVSHEPLRAGPPRSGSLRFRPTTEAALEYRIALEGSLTLLPAREIHYVDRGAFLIGRCELGIPAGVVQHLLSAPPVPSSMLAAVRRSLRPMLSPETARALLPERETASTDVETEIPLEPRLRVGLGTSDDGENRVVTDAEAVYGNASFPLGVWDPARPAARDLVEENRRLARLHELRGRFAHRFADGRAVSLLAEAKYVAHEVVPKLTAEGWSCRFAEDFPVEATGQVTGWVESLTPLSDAQDFFTLELGVTIAGRTVSLLPILLRAIREGILPLDPAWLDAERLAGITLRLPEGELVHVPGERLLRWVRPLLELQLRGLGKDGRLVVPALSAIALAGPPHAPFGDSGRLEALRARLAPLLALEPRNEAASFGAILRPYQRQGLAWLRFLHDAGYGGLLADDMGLGKTVQVLAFLHELAADEGPAMPALVVAPRSVVDHWQDETLRFAPSLQPHVHLGDGRTNDPEALRRHMLVLTTYQTLQRDRELFVDVPWKTVLFDEAQALKNTSTDVRRVAASLRARSRFAITGTPLENHLRELYSQIDLVMPGLLGKASTFDAVFRRPIEKFGNAEILELLRQRIRPFVLRRYKSEVEAELPEKVEIVEYVDLESDQRDLYESLRLSLDGCVREALREKGVHGVSLLVLDALLKLRQCCCDPRLLQVPGAPRVNDSAKLARLMSMLEALTESGRSVLVFSQFTSMLRLIEEACRAAEIPSLVLTGETRGRREVVRAFQAGEVPVLLVSLKAGGTGLNLTRADTVIHYDPWWNPAAEDQATDRAHRIGQDKRVFSYKLVARGTLEERILTMQREKRALTRAALHETGAHHLTATDFGALFEALA